jgi:hypothetical protein
MTSDGLGAQRPRHILFQDYVDNTTSAVYQPANIDLYLTDVQMQRGALGAVYLSDAPTPAQSKNMIHLPLVISPAIAWSPTQIKVRLWQHTRNWPVAYLQIYDAQGDYVGAINVRGTYVPPAFDFWTDYEGFARNTGSNQQARSILIANNTANTGVKRKWAARVKIRTDRVNNGLWGYNTAQGLVFQFDGSVYLRTGTMQAADAIIKPAGDHPLTVGATHLIETEINAAGTNIAVYVDGVMVGQFNGSNITMPLTKFGESGGSLTGWNGTIYSLQYSEDDVLVHEFRLNGNTGVETDLIGGVATANVGIGFIPVQDAADNSSPYVPEGALDLGSIPVTTGTTFTAAALLAGVTDLDGDTPTIYSVNVTSGNATASGTYKITPSAAGPGAGYIIITDGRGGFALRDLVWTGVA